MVTDKKQPKLDTKVTRIRLNKFVYQKRFDDCCDKRVLPFDFYIPSTNTCIEYQGRQHYMPVKVFGDEKDFELRKKHDEIKKKYCKDNNINFLEIPYTEFKNIGKILENSLEK